MAKGSRSSLYRRVREILESARASVARSVNSTQVVANWLIGREIVEEEQNGRGRAGYGDELLKTLSRQLGKSYGQGFSVSTLQYMRAFFQIYPALLEKQHAPRVEFNPVSFVSAETEIQHAPRAKSAVGRRSNKSGPIYHAVRDESWRPGRLHPNLSWTHISCICPAKRSFGQKSSVKCVDCPTCDPAVAGTGSRKSPSTVRRRTRLSLPRPLSPPSLSLLISPSLVHSVSSKACPSWLSALRVPSIG